MFITSLLADAASSGGPINFQRIGTWLASASLIPIIVIALIIFMSARKGSISEVARMVAIVLIGMVVLSIGVGGTDLAATGGKFLSMLGIGN